MERVKKKGSNNHRHVKERSLFSSVLPWIGHGGGWGKGLKHKTWCDISCSCWHVWEFCHWLDPCVVLSEYKGWWGFLEGKMTSLYWTRLTESESLWGINLYGRFFFSSKYSLKSLFCASQCVSNFLKFTDSEGSSPNMFLFAYIGWLSHLILLCSKTSCLK